jgi:hypothetical protein
MALRLILFGDNAIAFGEGIPFAGSKSDAS